MHETEAAVHGLDFEYRLIDTDRFAEPQPSLAQILDALESAGFTGVNVTHPYKRDAMNHIDVASENAQAIGAINTIVFRDGQRFGHNTDCWGFEAAFERDMHDAPKDRVLLIGAGGAGSAVARALLNKGVQRLIVRDIDAASVSALVERLGQHIDADRIDVAHDLEDAVARAQGIVNATPMGMMSHMGSPVPRLLLRPEQWVADIVYFPLQTKLLRQAKDVGCRTMPGTGMAIYQAVRAFELFTGHPAGHDTMRAAFDTFSDNAA